MVVDTWDDAAVAAAGELDQQLIEMLAESPKYQPITDAEEQLFLMREGDQDILWRGLAEIALAGYVRASRRTAATAVMQVTTTLIDKQYDYGTENILWAEERGLRGLVVRAHDKIARIQNLHRRGCAPKNESVLDSWLDLAGYSILGMMIDNNTFTLPLALDKDVNA